MITGNQGAWEDNIEKRTQRLFLQAKVLHERIKQFFGGQYANSPTFNNRETVSVPVVEKIGMPDIEPDIETTKHNKIRMQWLTDTGFKDDDSE